MKNGEWRKPGCLALSDLSIPRVVFWPASVIMIGYMQWPEDTTRGPTGAWKQGILTIGARLKANFRFRGMMDTEAGETGDNIRLLRGGGGLGRRLIVVRGKLTTQPW